MIFFLSNLFLFIVCNVDHAMIMMSFKFPQNYYKCSWKSFFRSQKIEFVVSSLDIQIK